MNQVIFGNNIDTLKDLAAQGVKVQMCVTSPPYYGLRSYLDEADPNKEHEIGLEQTPEEFIQSLVEVFRAVRDVMADDGTLWVNLGDSYYNYRPGKGQALVKQTSSNHKQDLPDTCPRRGNKLDGLKEKDLIGIPWMLAFALRADGWYLRQDIIWAKESCMPESVRDRCTKAHEYIFLLSKQPKYFYDHEAIKTPSKSKDNSQRDRDNSKLNNTPGRTRMAGLVSNGYDMANKRSVWTVNPKGYDGAHFAVYPEELIEPCILAGTSQRGHCPECGSRWTRSPEGWKPTCECGHDPVPDVVLDPFMGSGTTAAVAIKAGRGYLGCELNTEYAPLIDERIEQAQRNVPVHNTPVYHSLFEEE